MGPVIQAKNRDHLTEEWLQEHRFTDNARRMLHDIGKRGLDRGINGVLPPLLILWAMLRWEWKIGIAVLEAFGVELQEFERDVETELGALRQTDWKLGVDYGRIGEVAALACEEANALGNNWVGSEHLILALCRMDDEPMRRLFQKHGITPETYRPKLSELLRNCSEL